MPKLPTYSAKLDGGVISGGRRATAEDLGGADLSTAAHRIQKAGSDALTGIEEDESRKELVRQAEIRAKYSKRYDEAAVNNEDLDKIREELDNELSSGTEGYVTQKGMQTAALHAANTGALFENQANNIRVNRAVATARVDGQKFINGLAVQVSGDPSSLAANEQAVDDFVSLLSKVPDAQRTRFAAEWKQTLNVAAVRSLIRADPAQGRAAVESGKFNLTPEQMEQSISYAHSVDTANRAAAAAERAQKDYDLRQKDNAAEDNITRGILTGTMTGRKLADELANNPDLFPQTRRTLAQFAHSRAQEMTSGSRKSDQNVKFKLWEGIRSGEIANGALILAAANQHAQGKPGINTTDADALMRLVAEQRDPNNQAIAPRIRSVVSSFRRELGDNLKVKAAAINDSGLISAIALEYDARIRDRIEQLRASGGKGGDNPNDVFDSTSKWYVGSKEFRQSVVDSVMGAAKPEAVARKVAEGTKVFPDGTTRRYSGTGSIVDPNNWLVVEPGTK
jgi:hypothetical protein